jgi:pyruvate,water dikinase
LIPKNDALHPEDPYEFIDLLTHTDMASLDRNRMLEELADFIRNDPSLARQLKNKEYDSMPFELSQKIDTFIEKYGDLTCAVTGGTQCDQETEPLFNILLEMAAHLGDAMRDIKSVRKDDLKEKFLNCFEGDRRTDALEMLDLARTSYQLRDDDNIYLGRIESHLLAAIQEARRRIETHKATQPSDSPPQALIDILSDLDHRSKSVNPYEEKQGQAFQIKPRQLIGQPAGPGISRGNARVIQQHSDLAEFKHGEVLICDAVDPNMTFVVPLAAAVVERRGGMLILTVPLLPENMGCPVLPAFRTKPD